MSSRTGLDTLVGKQVMEIRLGRYADHNEDQSYRVIEFLLGNGDIVTVCCYDRENDSFDADIGPFTPGDDWGYWREELAPIGEVVG